MLSMLTQFLAAPISTPLPQLLSFRCSSAAAAAASGGAYSACSACSALSVLPFAASHLMTSQQVSAGERLSDQQDCTRARNRLSSMHGTPPQQRLANHARADYNTQAASFP